MIEYSVDGVRRTQLFDLRNDPREMKDLAAEPAHAGTISRLRASLASWQARVNDTGFPLERG